MLHGVVTLVYSKPLGHCLQLEIVTCCVLSMPSLVKYRPKGQVSHFSVESKWAVGLSTYVPAPHIEQLSGDVVTTTLPAGHAEHSSLFVPAFDVPVGQREHFTSAFG